ncbi:MAG: hypothetical protein GWP07_07255 [Xanthomonadaceae bacterium]|nr:hypothetical protein [Xanthomonadaceae bacterium]
MNKTWACEAAISVMIAALLLFLFFPVCRALAWDFSASAGFGYDDNPGRETDGEETCFTVYHLGCAKRFPVSEKFDLHAVTSLYIDYQDLAEVGDNFTGGLMAQVISPFWQGKGLATFFINPELYRDRYSREDEVNSATMGLETTYFLTSSLDLSGKVQVSYYNYCHKVIPLSGHGRRGEGTYQLSSHRKSLSMSGLLSATRENGGDGDASALPGQSSGHGVGKDAYKVLADREDWLTFGELSLKKTLLESLSLQIGTSYRRCHSTIELESFDGIGVSAGLEWLPVDLWSLSLTGWWLKRLYDRSPGGDNRHDDEHGARLSLTRSWEKFDLFVDFMVMRNQSPVNSEDYRRNVIQCGAIFLF